MLVSGVLSWHKTTRPHGSDHFIPCGGLVAWSNPCIWISVENSISKEGFPEGDLNCVCPEMCHAVICTAAIAVCTMLTVTGELLFSL